MMARPSSTLWRAAFQLVVDLGAPPVVKTQPREGSHNRWLVGVLSEACCMLRQGKWHHSIIAAELGRGTGASKSDLQRVR